MIGISLTKCVVQNSPIVFTRSFQNICTKNSVISLLCDCSFSDQSLALPAKNGSNLQQKLRNNLFSRSYCTQNEPQPPANKLPPLMTFPKIVWPSLIKSMRNFILATFIIKPYFDREFSLQEFVFGSKKAVEVVSKKLAEGDLKSLDGLVSSDILPSLQRSVSLMTLPQREQIAISMDDIYFSFPYQVQIGIIFNDDDENAKEQKRFVEITMVYHALRGLGVMRSKGEEPPINMGVLPEYQERLSICNYRFVREFTKGVDSDWTINLLNHFRPDDIQ